MAVKRLRSNPSLIALARVPTKVTKTKNVMDLVRSAKHSISKSNSGSNRIRKLIFYVAREFS